MKTNHWKITVFATAVGVALASFGGISEAGNPREARKLFAGKFKGKLTNPRVNDPGEATYKIPQIRGDMRVKPPIGKKKTGVNEPVIDGQGGKLLAKTKRLKIRRNGKKGIAQTRAVFRPEAYQTLDNPSGHAYKGTIKGISVLRGRDARGKGKVKMKSKRPDFLGGGIQKFTGVLKGKE